MSCCRAIASQFDRARVEKKLASYRKNGPDPTTRALIQALEQEGAHGRLLDIGGGLGAIAAALLGRGIEAALNLELSPAYLEASRHLSAEGGYADRLAHRLGDFVELAPEIEPADVVALDRVICCYPDLEPLVDLSAAKAKHLYGFAVPRTRWIVRLGIAAENLGRGLSGNPFRTYAHSIERMEAILERHGLARRRVARTFVWEVRVYAR